MSVRLLSLAVMVMMMVRTNDTKERHHREELGDQSQSSRDKSDQSERDLERLGCPMTLDIVNVKVNPILVNQQFKRAICHFDPPHLTV